MSQGQVLQARDSIQGLSDGATLRSSGQHGTIYPTLAPRDDARNPLSDQGLRQHATADLSSSTNGTQNHPWDFSVHDPFRFSLYQHKLELDGDKVRPRNRKASPEQGGCPLTWHGDEARSRNRKASLEQGGAPSDIWI